MDKCKIDGCNGLGKKLKSGKRCFTKGLCNNHYNKLLLYGDPLYVPFNKKIPPPEGFTDIKDYEGFYSINEVGAVWSWITGKFRKTSINNSGYKIVTLYLGKSQKVKTYLVHRLVAQTFIPNPDNKPEVNHLSGDKIDNSVENLEWVTTSENHKHAWRVGLKKVTEKYMENARTIASCRKVIISWNRKLSNEVVQEIYRKKGLFTQRYLAKLYNCGRGTIKYIHRKEIYKDVLDLVTA